jgi:3,4-dihydroxy 2-butanone 4-phosphate synthase/GTP cyclohydrolase II
MTNAPDNRIEVSGDEPCAAVASVEAALEQIRAGKMVILVDDADRENEGDLCIAAEKVTPETVNFMAMHGRGLVCLSLTDAQLERLHLPLMVPDWENSSGSGTAFTVSIEAREGVTTGISAADRSTTIRTALADDVKSSDIVRPGHVFPLRAREGGCCDVRGRPRARWIWRDSRDSSPRA